MTRPLDMTAEAVRFAELGYHVVPVLPRTRKPAFARFWESATSNVDTVRYWWSGPFADFGVGIVTGGADGLMVAELAVTAKVDGLARWEGLWSNDGTRVEPDFVVIMDLSPALRLVRLHYRGVVDGRVPSGRVVPGVHVYASQGLVLVPPLEHPFWGAR